ncbi:MAG: hypothetical protein BECKG1743D_GA0114223_102873 [Candidatus Kentron sp. G]|nr:MAG: hypothetical protein BECKG1743D_GA0114223_102873 [Candidatus Kentron sp. G]
MKKSPTYCGGSQIAAGGVAKAPKSGHVARYTPRFWCFRALPVTFGNRLATVGNFFTASEAISSAFQDAQRESDLATKADIRVVETKVDALARDINSLRWILGVIVILTVIPLINNLIG